MPLVLVLNLSPIVVHPPSPSSPAAPGGVSQTHSISFRVLWSRVVVDRHRIVIQFPRKFKLILILIVFNSIVTVSGLIP